MLFRWDFSCNVLLHHFRFLWFFCRKPKCFVQFVPILPQCVVWREFVTYCPASNDCVSLVISCELGFTPIKMTQQWKIQESCIRQVIEEKQKAKSVEQVPLALIHRVLTIGGGERKSERLYDLIVTDMTKMPTLHYGFVSHARLPHAPFMLLQLCSAPRLEQARTAILWAQMIPCMEALSRTTVCLAMRRTREMLLELVKPMLHGVELPWIANVM